MKLNLGCGRDRRPGYVNVDKYATFAPDRVVDLEAPPWPFPDGAVDEIVLHHVLEHLGQSTEVFLAIIRELYRVLKPGGVAEITVPHPRSDLFLGDPTHVRAITPAMFQLMSRKNCAEFERAGTPHSQLATVLEVDFEVTQVRNRLAPAWAQRAERERWTQAQVREAADTYNNVIEEIFITLRKVA
ncbi:class I SAM-dependent methyltransferase [Magnetospirillum sp. UT-4]|uniref:class I SAM-dependent methyltransferase n=1 Tax=Magnetospirillum sp. UT-4 TaxID=2681467 RepID=UPI00137DE2F8|nr:class I SAM-dependent methyltransferase [Magnetospirillum sp. UT-4]CAA7617323.1 conserved hypothetical protein [Magnetospirillum sp. UT-4]